MSEIVLRVDFATAVRFKYSPRISKRHAFWVQGDVKVSTVTGKKVSPNDIKLSGQDSGGHYKAFIEFSFWFNIFLTLSLYFCICCSCAVAADS